MKPFWGGFLIFILSITLLWGVWGGGSKKNSDGFKKNPRMITKKMTMLLISFFYYHFILISYFPHVNLHSNFGLFFFFCRNPPVRIPALYLLSLSLFIISVLLFSSIKHIPNVFFLCGDVHVAIPNGSFRWVGEGPFKRNVQVITDRRIGWDRFRLAQTN